MYVPTHVQPIGRYRHGYAPDTMLIPQSHKDAIMVQRGWHSRKTEDEIYVSMGNIKVQLQESLVACDASKVSRAWLSANTA